MSAIRRSVFWWNVSKYVVLAWARVWLRLRVEGREHIPRRGPVLLVANHSSFLDPPLVGIMAPRWVTFIARESLSHSRLAAWWLRHMGVVLIDRAAPSKDLLKTVTRFLGDGNCVGLFPEGTRSRDGAVGPFRGGLELLVRRSGAAVIPVGLCGAHRVLPRGALLPRPRKVIVRVGQPWPAERVMTPGGVEALRAEVARLAAAPLRADADPQTPPEASAEATRDGTGPDPIRAASPHSATLRSEP